MKQYLDMLQHIMDTGVEKTDRTGTGTKSVFGYQMRFDLAKGFPLVTTKKLHLKAIIHELLWFIKGDTNVKYLKDNGVTIWDEWAREDGDLGPVYGKQWRSWSDTRLFYDTDSPEVFQKGGYRTVATDDNQNEVVSVITGHRNIDQLKNVIERIKTHPDCRRLIVSAWNVAELELMALMPCHVMFQFYIANNKLSCQLYQRSQYERLH